MAVHAADDEGRTPIADAMRKDRRQVLDVFAKRGIEALAGASVVATAAVDGLCAGVALARQQSDTQRQLRAQAVGEAEAHTRAEAEDERQLQHTRLAIERLSAQPAPAAFAEPEPASTAGAAASECPLRRLTTLRSGARFRSVQHKTATCDIRAKAVRTV